MNKLFVPLFMFLPGWVIAQTGPGGVGDNTGTSTLSAWYDANQGVTTSGTAVTIWGDQSGFGNDATPPAASNQPTLTTSAVNTYPVLTFDGSTDYLTAPDDNSLDLTTWSIFIVGQVNVEKNFNAIVVKGDDADENYEFLTNFPGNGNIHYPVRYTNGQRSTDSDADDTFSNSAYGIYQLDYDQANFNLYIDGDNTETDGETRTPETNTNELYICNEESTTGREFSGTIAEIMIFSSPVNFAQQLIINNYLAAKYGLTLSANDIYNEDDNGNGDYDHDVAGIGQASDGSSHTDSRGTGVVRINNPGGLGNNEFLFWGHDNGSMNATEIGDVPSGVEARLERVWRVSERNETNTSNVNVGTLDISFDLTGMGTITASDLRLLIDTDSDGNFADESAFSGATDLGGNVYQFTSVPGGAAGIRNNRRFTLGTSNSTQTPLPITLTRFDAEPSNNGTVLISWQTAAEINNAFFTIERAADGKSWEPLKKVAGARNSTQLLDYAVTDAAPLPGISYYRLKQTDFNGNFTHSHVEQVVLDPLTSEPVALYPNPVSKRLTVTGTPYELSEVHLTSAMGETVSGSIRITRPHSTRVTIDMSQLPPGLYFVHTRTTVHRVIKE